MEYLSRKGVPFVAKDIREDKGAMRELVEDLDSKSTPTIVVDGKIMVGFERAKLDQMLAEAGF
jgi:glutaredoxin